MELRRDMKVTSILLMLYFSGGECDKTISGHLKYIAEIFIAFIYYLFMWTYCVWRSESWELVLSSTIWVLGLELRLSGLVASPCPAAHVCTCTFLWVPMKKALTPPELKLQVVVSHPTWMLETELPASTRATSVLNPCAISSALKCLLIDCGYFTTLSSKKIETFFLKYV